MRNVLRSGLILAMVWPAALIADQLPHQLPRWLHPGKSADYTSFESPDRRFSLEYPKDWRVVPGAGSLVLVFTQNKSEASVAVERITLKQSLAPDDITQLFADLEVDHVKERDMGAQSIRTALRTDADGRRMIVIDYSRSGLKGLEQVRQYTMPIGTELFRLICSGGATTFAKYDVVFEHMAGTFKVTTSAPGATTAWPTF